MVLAPDSGQLPGYPSVLQTNGCHYTALAGKAHGRWLSVDCHVPCDLPAEAPTALVLGLDYLFTSICIAEPCKMATVPVYRAESGFAVQYKNISLWGKDWASCFQPIKKTLGFLSLGFFSCDANPLHVHHAPGPPLSPQRDFGDGEMT